MASVSKGTNQDPESGNQTETNPPTDTPEEPTKFTWMDDSPQWGTKAVPSKRGLTLD